MSKTLPIELGEKTYTLEYNRFAVKKIEQLGFTVQGLGQKLVTNIELMFYGAFIKNHGSDVRSIRDSNEILDKLADEYNTEDLVEILSDMIVETVPSMNADASKKSLKIVER